VVCDQSPRFSNRDSSNIHSIQSPIGFNHNLLTGCDEHSRARGIHRNNNPSNLDFSIAQSPKQIADAVRFP
jgi:hypothetical protein